jgi:hypothetical protein
MLLGPDRVDLTADTIPTGNPTADIPAADALATVEILAAETLHTHSVTTAAGVPTADASVAQLIERPILLSSLIKIFLEFTNVCYTPHFEGGQNALGVLLHRLKSTSQR